MVKHYQDIYPEAPLLDSAGLARPSATELLTLEYFEAEPGEMPYEVFSQHHILVNLKSQPHRVEHWCDGEHRDFIYHQDEIILTPAGLKTGWKWHATSNAIVITLAPQKLREFAQNELGIVLAKQQLKTVSQLVDSDIAQAARLLLEALNSEMGSAVMFESYARVFLTKLLQKYRLQPDEDGAFNRSFTSAHYKRVLDYVAAHFQEKQVTVEDLAAQTGMSTYHFARLFKQTIGQSPHQFVMHYRVEQARKQLLDPSQLMVDIALACGFSDQAHFSRTFKQLTGTTPKAYRAQTKV